MQRQTLITKELKSSAQKKHSKVSPIKEQVKPINQRGKDNLNKFVGQHERQQHVENRSRHYQLRIALKEKEYSTKIKNEILPDIQFNERVIKEGKEVINSLLPGRDNEINRNLIYSAITDIRKAKKEIIRLREKIDGLILNYKFRFAIFKSLFNLLQSTNSGYGIEFGRNYIYSITLPYETVKAYSVMIKEFLNSLNYRIIKHRKPVNRYNNITMQVESFKPITNETLASLFHIGFYRETKNKKHHLRQVTPRNLLKFQSLPNLSELANELNSEHLKQYLTEFDTNFTNICKFDKIQITELQTDLTIWGKIQDFSKRYESRFPSIDYIEDIMSDAYIYFTLERVAYSLSDEDLVKEISKYFRHRYDSYLQSRTIEITEENENIVFGNLENGYNTAYQIERKTDLQIFTKWIETRKFIKEKTKKVMLFVLDNANMPKIKIMEELSIRYEYLENAIKKLTDYAKTFNDFSIYEFLMMKFFPSYELPKKLKGKAGKRIAEESKVKRQRKIKNFNELRKAVNYQLAYS